MSVADFDFIRVLGEGAFAKVFLVSRKSSSTSNDGNKYALKEINKQSINERDTLTYVANEIVIQTQAQHPNIVKCHEFFHDDFNVYLVMEYMNKSLLDEMAQQKYNHLPEKRTAFIMLSLSSALTFLHERGIIHRDIKPENLLLDRNGTVKLSDFGIAAYSPDRKTRRTVCGTSHYVAPESKYQNFTINYHLLIMHVICSFLVVQRKPYNEKVDLWSMGIVCHELLTGEYPEYKISARLSIQARRFIQSLLKLQPNLRMSAADVQHHSWILEKS